MADIPVSSATNICEVKVGRVSAGRISLAVLSGTVIGLTTCSIFAFPVLARPVSTTGFVAVPILATLLGGGAFGGLLARARNQLDDIWPRMLGLAGW